MVEILKRWGLVGDLRSTAGYALEMDNGTLVSLLFPVRFYELNGPLLSSVLARMHYAT